jgi:uncharacterized protein (DUF362 family)
MSDLIPILLDRCSSYERRRIKDFCESAFNKLGLKRSYHGKTVLLKPNLISSRASNLACSDARIVRATAEWFVDNGAAVQVGDSPSFGSAEQVLRKRGIRAALDGLDVAIIEFSNPLEKTLTHGVKVGVAAQVLGCDLLVNLPRVKAHSQMYVTLAVKNLFGIVCGMRKALCHMKNGLSHTRFGDLMLDLTTLVPRQVALVDGIEAMHKRGPIKGELLKLGLLAAGRDPIALDTALLSVLELDHRKCPIWRAADRRAFSGARPGSIGWLGEPPEAFHGSGFRAPAILNPVPFNPVRFLFSSLRRAAAKRG